MRVKCANQRMQYTMSMSTRANKLSRGTRRLSRRGDTRKLLIDTALSMLDGDKSFDGLSLRELTREVGIVPTGFYRHFPDMDALGLALVEESFRSLRRASSRGHAPPAACLKSGTYKNVEKSTW